jgi:hypothetical protein
VLLQSIQATSIHLAILYHAPPLPSQPVIPPSITSVTPVIDSSTKLAPFPSSRERENYTFWYRGLEAFLKVKGLLLYIQQPVYGVPEEPGRC